MTTNQQHYETKITELTTTLRELSQATVHLNQTIVQLNQTIVNKEEIITNLNVTITNNKLSFEKELSELEKKLALCQQGCAQKQIVINEFESLIVKLRTFQDIERSIRGIFRIFCFALIKNRYLHQGIYLLQPSVRPGSDQSR